MLRITAISTFVILLMAGSTFAVGPLGGLGAGVKGGVNYSNIVASDINSSARLGFIGGAYVTLPIGSIKLQPEVLYAMRGYKADDIDITIKLDYIEVPILLRYDFPSAVGTGPYIYAGPVISFLQNAKSGSIDIKDACHSNVTSAVIGGGVSISTVLNLDGRFLYGLSDVFDTSVLTTDDGEKHMSFSLMAVYALGL